MSFPFVGIDTRIDLSKKKSRGSSIGFVGIVKFAAYTCKQKGGNACKHSIVHPIRFDCVRAQLKCECDYMRAPETAFQIIIKTPNRTEEEKPTKVRAI